MRIGIGYDVHRLVEGRDLIIGGVRIPFERGLLGHSDADVLIHAIIDALIGAMAAGDIGVHFPDTDEAYAGISGAELLKRVKAMLTAGGYAIENIDSVVIAQSPRLRPYIDGMREAVADALGVETAAVNIKAKTEEGLGFTGNGEGIAAKAVCLLRECAEASTK